MTNYTAEMTLDLVQAYELAETQEERTAVVEAFAEKFEKTVASIRAKLVREGVYVKAATTKTRTRVMKDELVAAIAKLTNAEEEEMESLSKATKEALTIVYGRLNAMVDEENRVSL